MGANSMDYIIADKLVIPNKFENFYSENIFAYQTHICQLITHVKYLTNQ